MMRRKSIVRSISAFFALTAVVALLAPLAGPALDHHFAERQPDHLHFGTPGEHSHAYESPIHIHRHGSSTPVDGNLPVALYRSDGAIAVTLAGSHVDVDSESMRLFQPTSVFFMPPHFDGAVRQHSPAPPDRPPTVVT